MKRDKKVIKKLMFSLLVITLSIYTTGKLSAQSNDLCANATVLQVNQVCEASSFISGNNTTAGYEGEYFNCVSGPDVFYTFNSGDFEAVQFILNSGVIEYAVLEVLSSCGGSTILCAIATTSLNTHIVEVMPNTNYIVRISSALGPQGSFEICLSGVVPENDFCVDAIPMEVNGEPVVVNNTNASPDGAAMECTFYGDEIQHDVWYSFVAPETGDLIIKTWGNSGQLTDTEIQIFDACGDNGIVIACNDDIDVDVERYSLIVLECGSYTSGSTYYIQVDGFDGDNGTCNIAISMISCENGATRCSDGIDNDGNGLIDCEDPACQVLNNNQGCITCLNDGSSFADEVIGYNNTCPSNTKTTSSNALGMPDYTGVNSDSYVSLGEGGFVKVLFSDNLLTNSGNSEPDLFVFEVGPSIEPISIELRPFDQSSEDQIIASGVMDVDSDGYYEFGILDQTGEGLDLDALLSALPANSILFDAVKIMDVDDRNCVVGSAGADIDGVCALSNIVRCAYLDVTPIEIDGGEVIGDNTGHGPGGPFMECAYGIDLTLRVDWFSFVAPDAGGVAIETSAIYPNGLLDTQIQVVEGCDANATVIACNDDISLYPSNYFSFIHLECDILIPGEIYYIQVDGYASFEGAFNISVTSIPCSDAIISGNVSWIQPCSDRNAEVNLYEPGSNNLVETYTTDVDLNGDFTIDDVLIGNYDVFIKVDGYLQKGFANVLIESGINEIEVGGIAVGDVNNDNSVSILDASLFNASFGSTLGNSSNYNPLADLNCDGLTNIIDFSLLNTTFSQVGDTPP